MREEDESLPPGHIYVVVGPGLLNWMCRLALSLLPVSQPAAPTKICPLGKFVCAVCKCIPIISHVLTMLSNFNIIVHNLCLYFPVKSLFSLFTFCS